MSRRVPTSDQDTEPLASSSMEDVLEVLSEAHLDENLSLEQRDALYDRALAWVDLNEPGRALAARNALCQLEVARNLMQFKLDRTDVDTDLVIAKTLALILAFVQDQIDPQADGDTMAGYFDRGIPSLVSNTFGRLADDEAVGFGRRR